MKKNLYYIAGLVFIWLIPIVCLIVMAFNGKTDGIKIKTWVSVAMVLMVAIYYIKGKKEIGKIKERQLSKYEYVKVYIRVIEWVMVMIPFIVVLLLLENIKTNINEAITFIIICMVSVSIGYLLLCIDSKTKEKK